MFTFEEPRSPAITETDTRIPWPSGRPCTPSCQEHGSCWRRETGLAPKVGCEDGDDYGCEECGLPDADCWCGYGDDFDDEPSDSELEEMWIEDQIAAAEEAEIERQIEADEQERAERQAAGDD
jgi:hypothetical protein